MGFVYFVFHVLYIRLAWRVCCVAVKRYFFWISPPGVSRFSEPFRHDSANWRCRRLAFYLPNSNGYYDDAFNYRSAVLLSFQSAKTYLHSSLKMGLTVYQAWCLNVLCLWYVWNEMYVLTECERQIRLRSDFCYSFSGYCVNLFCWCTELMWFIRSFVKKARLNLTSAKLSRSHLIKPWRIAAYFGATSGEQQFSITRVIPDDIMRHSKPVSFIRLPLWYVQVNCCHDCAFLHMTVRII